MFVSQYPNGANNTGLNATSFQACQVAQQSLLGLLVGGMMAVDMGGPVNKAACMSSLQVHSL